MNFCAGAWERTTPHRLIGIDGIDGVGGVGGVGGMMREKKSHGNNVIIVGPDGESSTMEDSRCDSCPVLSCPVVCYSLPSALCSLSCPVVS